MTMGGTTGQRIVGGLQIAGGIVDMLYGGGYGGTGGGLYLIGHGIDNVSGDPKGSAHVLTARNALKDTLGSMEAQGSSYAGGQVGGMLGGGALGGLGGTATSYGLGSLMGGPSVGTPAAIGTLAGMLYPPLTGRSQPPAQPQPPAQTTTPQTPPLSFTPPTAQSSLSPAERLALSFGETSNA